jgi:hypothetical protein
MLQSSAFPSCANDGTSIRLYNIFCLAQARSELPMTNSRVVCPPRINQFFLPCCQSATFARKDQGRRCGRLGTALWQDYCYYPPNRKEQGGRHDVCIRQFDHWVRRHNNHRCNMAGAHNIRRPFTVMLRNQHRLANRGAEPDGPIATLLHAHGGNQIRASAIPFRQSEPLSIKA